MCQIEGIPNFFRFEWHVYFSQITWIVETQRDNPGWDPNVESCRWGTGDFYGMAPWLFGFLQIVNPTSGHHRNTAWWFQT